MSRSILFLLVANFVAHCLWRHARHDGLLYACSAEERSLEVTPGEKLGVWAGRLLEEPRLAILYVHRLARACGCWPRVLRLLVFAARRRTSSALLGEHCLVLANLSARTEILLATFGKRNWARVVHIGDRTTDKTLRAIDPLLAKVPRVGTPSHVRHLCPYPYPSPWADAPPTRHNPRTRNPVPAPLGPRRETRFRRVSAQLPCSLGSCPRCRAGVTEH